MRGEDRGDADVSQQTQGFVPGDARCAQPAQRSAQAAALRCCIGVQQGGAAATLAVVGLGKIDELKVGGEGARQAIGRCGVGGGLVGQRLGFVQMQKSGGLVSGGFGFTALGADGVIVVPIRTGVGARLGVNLSYLKFTPRATWNPF